ncbi:lipocalin family protein [Pseudoalteromonas sp. McH1-7]|uniref:lipocalin family protein n=1 Tax=unclassified Pseudoalteromonas TaxID=194690 RepID=UPI001590C2AA|nr:MULTISPECIES: lipocalin family protein [unclassified Pseudoalteromonas]NUZ10922.1 lipocalin family protein [Pseudoalteromonas sp. McH1-7]USD30510.1 lipocalin family protein [Pseudoalteromonas sp. SCSIO 43201]
MKLRQLLLGAIVTISMAACTGLPNGIEPVKEFNVERYQGTWYEIARLDHAFERGMQNVTATYSQNSDGSIKVVNRGYVTEERVWKEAIGKAKFVANKEIAHLKVSFFGPFYGSYVVFELDEDYQYAFVTSYNRDYLWLLSRTPKVSEAVMNKFKATSDRYGFDTEALIYMEHEAIEPE